MKHDNSQPAEIIPVTTRKKKKHFAWQQSKGHRSATHNNKACQTQYNPCFPNWNLSTS